MVKRKLPDFWTHIIAGKEMVTSSRQDLLRKSMEKAKTSFNFGCQGPDFLFYNLLNPLDGPMLGKKMHKKKLGKSVIQAARFGKQNSSSQLRAYLIGFITHILVDRDLHPFILARSPDYTTHKKLENELDVFLVQHFLGLDLQEINTFQQIEFAEEIPAEITDFFQYLSAQVYDNPRGEKALTYSYSYFKLLQSLLNGPGNIRRAAIKAANFVIPYDLDTLMYGEGGNMLWLEEKRRFLHHYQQTTLRGSQILNFIGNYWRGVNSEQALEFFLANLDFEEPKEAEILATLPA